MFSLGTAHLFSRSGMLRFLAAKHILSGMTFLSLVLFWCFGEPESSLPLKLGDWGAALSQGRSDTNDGFLIYGVTSRMNLTTNKSQRRRSVFLLPMKNSNWNIYIQEPSGMKWKKKIHKVKEPTHRILGLEGALRAQVIQMTPLVYPKNWLLSLHTLFLLRTPFSLCLPGELTSSAAYPIYSLQGVAITHSSVITSKHPGL